MSPAQEVSGPGQRQEPWHARRLILEGLQVPLFRVKLGNRGGGLGGDTSVGKEARLRVRRMETLRVVCRFRPLGTFCPGSHGPGRKPPLP